MNKGQVIRNGNWVTLYLNIDVETLMQFLGGDLRLPARDIIANQDSYLRIQLEGGSRWDEPYRLVGWFEKKEK